ncbi:sensor histidine kinase [Nocardia macrotermitis]|nr:histidine kinase [Nocardia macrotermitis]
MHRTVPRTDLVLGIVALLFTGLSWTLAAMSIRDHAIEYLCLAVFSTGVAAAVPVRRTRPVTSFAITCVMFGAMAVTAQLSPVYLSVEPILLFAPISLLAVTEYARSWWWGPVGLVIGIVVSLGSPAVRMEHFAWSVTYHVVVLAAEYLWGSRRRAVRAAHERDLAAARGNERARIAAELHDVLGHTLVAVRAQAGAGLVIAERRGESTAEVLRTVAEITKDALGDVRHLVGLLRDGHDGTASADSFADLRDTVRRARAAGVTVEEELPSDVELVVWQQTWPAPIRLAVLRVVREAVTNVIKHAGPGASMRVRIGRESGNCVVVIENTGVVPRNLGAGRGLAGLRERMSSVGGTLEVVPTESGVRLAARIPTRTPDGYP